MKKRILMVFIDFSVISLLLTKESQRRIKIYL